jgi:hypothetical protein
MFTLVHSAILMKTNNRAGQLGRALLSSNALFKRKKVSIGIIIFLLLIISVMLLPSSHKLLVIEEVRTGKILWQHEIETEEWFRHEYIHSVEKSIVIEKFKLDESGQILAMESWTRSFGAGMPYEQKGTVEMKDGFYILKDLNDPINVIHMQPSHLYQHTFHFKEEKVLLSEPPYTRNLLRIEVRDMQLWQYLLLSVSGEN